MIVPGIWNSDADHWQTHWERADGARAVRIEPTSWDDPDPDDWVAAIDRAVTTIGATVGGPPVIVAHSLGVLAAARWLVEHDGDGRVAGAFLVAPPDPDGPGFPVEARGFTGPTAAVTTPTVLVASDDDPWCPLDRAVAMAEVLGAEVLRVGALGHVNVAAGVGSWEAGRALLAAFEAAR